MSPRLGSGPAHVITSRYSVTTVIGLVTLMLANNIEQTAGLQPRGGRLLEGAYDMFNKWVVVFRVHSRMGGYEHTGVPETGNRYSYGYGLYYRENGWLLAHMESAIIGTKAMKEKRMNMSGWFIHSQERKRLVKNHESNRVGVRPYRIIMSHALTYPGPSVGIFQAYLDNYEEVIRAPPFGQPARAIVYPMQAWLPKVVKRGDQRINCYVFIHDFHDDDRIAGYNGSIPYQWRYWPIERKGPCEGGICKFAPHVDRIGIGASNDQSHAGQICDIAADRGAPIFCHAKDTAWTDTDSPSFIYGQRLDNDWKLAYTVLKPVSVAAKACSRVFTAFDLSYARDMLFDDSLDILVDDHYRPNPNPPQYPE